MKSLMFKGSFPIAGSQQKYTTIHAAKTDDGSLIMIFELSDEELKEINRTKKIVYRRSTFGTPFQPFNILTQWPGDSVPEILPDINSDPKLN
jgi:hypothetical protein